MTQVDPRAETAKLVSETITPSSKQAVGAFDPFAQRGVSGQAE